jgi:hypothetical protein
MFIAMRQQATRRPVLFVAVLVLTVLFAGIVFGAILADAQTLAQFDPSPTAVGQVVSTVLALLGLLILPQLMRMGRLRTVAFDDHRRPRDAVDLEHRAPNGPTLPGLCRIQV